MVSRGIFAFLLCVHSGVSVGLLGQDQVPTPVTSQTEDSQRLMKEGLQAEALRNYPEAVDRYVRAMKADPKSGLARSRIISIFKSLKEQDQSPDLLLPLVPDTLTEELRRLGYVRTSQDEAAFLEKMNMIFWGASILFVILVFAFIIYMFKRVQASQDQKAFSTNKSLSQSKRQTSKTSENFSKRETVITERTRQEITGVITNVKSLTGAQMRPPELEPKTDTQALEQSGVLDALAQTMISEVATEETEKGKFSKMSLDASLVFDEDDLPPDLVEWRKEHGDDGIESYLERLHKQELKKKKEQQK